MIYEELSGEIIGAAMVVLNELKPGLDEKLYERAITIELKHRGHSVSVQSLFPVSYRGELIGNPDLIVDNVVIVDPKVVSCFTDTHVAQMIGYLNITRLDLALSLILRTHDWNGNECCARKNPIRRPPDPILIFMLKSSHPCYPCNPWLMP